MIIKIITIIPKKIWKWCTATRLRKVLSSFLSVLVLLTSVRYVFFLNPKEAYAADVYLGFDEGYGTTSAVHDTNSTVSAGSITNAVWRSEEFCKTGKCLYFDGDGDYVSFADDADLDFAGADSGTFEGWFRHAHITADIDIDNETGDTTQYSSVVATNNSFSSTAASALNNTSYGIAVMVNDTSDVYGRKDITPDGNGVIRYGFYFDPNGFTIPSGTFTLANLRTSGGTSLSFITFSNPYQVRASLNNDASAANYTNYYTLSDAPHYIEIEIHRATGSTASNGYLELRIDNEYKETVTGIDFYDLLSTGLGRIDFGATGLDSGQTGTFYIDELQVHTGTPQTILAKNTTSTGTDGGYKVQMENDGDISCGIDNENTYFPSDSAFSSTAGYDDNKWHHYACVKNGSTSLSLYLDGNLINTDSSITSSTLANTDSLYVGIDGDGASNDFQGFIDEVKVTRSARTADQVKADYNGVTPSRGTSASFGPDQSWLTNGLVGYWKLDEATNTARADYSGNGNTLTESTGDDIDSVGGKFGNGGDFENSSSEAENILISDASQVGLDVTDTLSLCAWINPESTVTGSIVGKYSTSNFSYQIQTYGSGILRFLVSSNGTNSSSASSDSSAINTGTWTYVCGSYDGNYLRTYINGSLSGTPTAFTSGIYNGGSDFTIGGAWGDYFDGKVDDVRVYNRALSPDEIRRLTDWAPGPVAHWKMDENTGTSANDSSGNGNTGTATSANHIAGKYGQARNFANDSNFSVSAGNPSILQITSGLSISGWVYLMNADTSHVIVAKSGTTNTTFGWRLRTGSSGNAVFEVDTDGNGPSYDTQAVSASALSIKRWYHIAGTYAPGTSLKVYINGALDGEDSTSVAAQIYNSANNLYIGAEESGNTTKMNGYIDDVRVYNYARTPEQIVEDMNGGHPAPGSPVGSALGHWDMDEGYSTTVHNSGSLGSSADGTFAGTANPTWTNSGKFGKAVNFVTTGNNSINLTNSVSTKGLSEYTISAWINPTSLPTNGNNYDIWAEPVADSLLSLRAQIHLGNNYSGCGTNVISLAFRTGTSASTRYDVCGTTTLSTGNWYHVVGVFNSNTDIHKVYLNGKENGTLTQAVSAVDNTNPNDVPRIGIFPNGNSDFDGIIDNVSFYNFALTPDQVKAEYNQGSAEVMGALSTNYNAGTITASNSESDSFCPPGQTSACTPPVGYWKMDEGSWTNDCSTDTVFDSSGNGYNGDSCPNGTGPKGNASGKIGNAGKFDESNDYILTSGNTKWDSMTNVTVSFWMKPGIQSAINYIFNKYASSSDAWGVRMTTDNWLNIYDDIDNGILGSGCAGGGVNITPGEWYHVAVTLNAGSSNANEMYINGRPIGCSHNSTASWNSYAGNLYIGARYNTTGTTFNGIIDDFKVYDYVRTQSQIAWDYNRGAPVAWWQMDESSWNGTANEVKDASGNAFHGVRSGNATTSSAGKINFSGTFDGTGDYVQINPTGALNITDQISISLWVKGTDWNNGHWGRIISRDLSPNQRWFIENNGSTPGKLRYDVNGGGDSNATLQNGIWYHLVMVYNGTNSVSLYINGELDSSYAATDPTASGNIFIGGDSGGNDFTGQIDDVRIFNYALTAQQVKLIMNDGSAVRIAPLTGAPQ